MANHLQKVVRIVLRIHHHAVATDAKNPTTHTNTNTHNQIRGNDRTMQRSGFPITVVSHLDALCVCVCA